MECAAFGRGERSVVLTDCQYRHGQYVQIDLILFDLTCIDVTPLPSYVCPYSRTASKVQLNSTPLRFKRTQHIARTMCVLCARMLEMDSGKLA